MNNRPFRDHHNYIHDHDDTLEHPSGDSMTEQGMALSIQEILERHLAGDLLKPHQSIYDDDPSLDDIDQVKLAMSDLVDREKFKADASTALLDVQLNQVKNDETKIVQQAQGSPVQNNKTLDENVQS